MTNSVDPDQTAPIGAVRSGSTLFASILKLVSNIRQLFAADDFSRHHFSDAFFLGALRVKGSPHIITKLENMMKLKVKKAKIRNQYNQVPHLYPKHHMGM